MIFSFVNISNILALSVEAHSCDISQGCDRMLAAICRLL